MIIICIMAKTIDITVKECKQELTYLLRKQNKITEMVGQLKPELVKSITGYELYTKTFYEQNSS